MNAADQHADRPNQPKSRSGPEPHDLSRCAGCYNQRAGFMPHHGGGDSSSSAEDSGPEAEVESEEESSSSSCCSEKALSEILEELPPESTEPPPGGKDGDGREATAETSESRTDRSRRGRVTRRAPLVKSYSLPTSFKPHLIPLSLLPRPRTVISTLNLQVLSRKHNNDTFYVRQHPSERVEEKTEVGTGGRLDGVNLLPPQMGLPWQPRSQETSPQYQFPYRQQPHQQPQHFPPLPAHSQRLPPPPHTLPVSYLPTLYTPLQAPHTHLRTPTDPQLCWYCYSMQFPYSPYWSHYRSGHLPR